MPFHSPRRRRRRVVLTGRRSTHYAPWKTVSELAVPAGRSRFSIGHRVGLLVLWYRDAICVFLPLPLARVLIFFFFTSCTFAPDIFTRTRFASVFAFTFCRYSTPCVYDRCHYRPCDHVSLSPPIFTRALISFLRVRWIIIARPTSMRHSTCCTCWRTGASSIVSLRGRSCSLHYLGMGVSTL